MERKFTSFCITIAVLFAVVAYLLGHGDFSALKCAGSGFCVMGVIAYLVLAILCSRKVPDVT